MARLITLINSRRFLGKVSLFNLRQTQTGEMFKEFFARVRRALFVFHFNNWLFPFLPVEHLHFLGDHLCEEACFTFVFVAVSL